VQRETIRALFTPIIQVWSRVLALPIVGGLDQGRVEEITQSLLEAIVKSGCSFVILDLTGGKEVDAATADHLLRIGRAARLLGTRCLLSGLSGAVASSFTALDINLRDLVSFSSLESALHYALLQMGDLPRTRAAPL
jgi:anti-anti-sigma regulatory factor